MRPLAAAFGENREASAIVSDAFCVGSSHGDLPRTGVDRLALS